MSVTGISTEGGGAGQTFTACTTSGCPSFPTSTLSSQLSFTATLTLPVPPPGSTTVTSLIYLSPTSITTTTTATTSTTTATTSTNFISTTTATTLSVTALPNPAATAALQAQNTLLNQNASLTRTNLTVTIVLGAVSLVLLIILLILLLICFRRRNSKSPDSESPPFTSLAPRPAPNFGPTISPPPQIPLPEHMRETSLSMGPRGGTADSYAQAMLQGQAVGWGASPSGAPQFPSQSGRGQGQPFQFQFPYPSGITRPGQDEPGSQAQALASNPVSPPTRTRLMRSSSAPTSAPEPPPTIPPFQDFQDTNLGLGLPRISLFPATPFSGSRDSINLPGTASGSGRPGTEGSGSNRGMSPGFGAELRRQRSAPMYHRALREQVEAQREEEAGREAQRLGVPVIGYGERRESGGSDISSEMSFGSEDVEIRAEEKELEAQASGSGTRREERESGEGGGGDGGQGTGGRGRVLHSTRASSGVFPEGPGSEAGVEEKDVYS
ncbi:uncharacterized protein PAC_11333 [Phialocephala subalpina]|uniref:Uncharacterized protein n=1 Tax=Phialocephala subalpina TaxID=576137 RepID=A0A1L7X8X2_9HELO|nr:uncharacterized protein PAC_11333 [Phialocephala subalpina]